jgi:HSP20 family protein
MTYTFWKPLPLSLNLEERIESMFAELIHEPWRSTALDQIWQPAIDIYETDDAYIVEADLPGVSPENIHVEIAGQWVTISGKRDSATLVPSARGLRLERSRGRFVRKFYLNEPIDLQAVESRHTDGIYQLRLPKQRPRQEGE